jgi:hypothetical protein
MQLNELYRLEMYLGYESYEKMNEILQSIILKIIIKTHNYASSSIKNIV